MPVQQAWGSGFWIATTQNLHHCILEKTGSKQVKTQDLRYVSTSLVESSQATCRNPEHGQMCIFAPAMPATQTVKTVCSAHSLPNAGPCFWQHYDSIDCTGGLDSILMFVMPSPVYGPWGRFEEFKIWRERVNSRLVRLVQIEKHRKALAGANCVVQTKFLGQSCRSLHGNRTLHYILWNPKQSSTCFWPLMGMQCESHTLNVSAALFSVWAALFVAWTTCVNRLDQCQQNCWCSKRFTILWPRSFAVSSFTTLACAL